MALDQYGNWITDTNLLPIAQQADISNLGQASLPDIGGSSGSWMDALGGYQGIQGMLGAGQLGLGFLGYLDNKKTADKQRQLLGQQIDTNQFLLGQAKGRQADIAKAFGGSAPQGLAANQARKVL